MNSNNLIPINKRTKSEAREISRKGGVASAASRAKKKNLRELINYMLECAPPIDKISELMQQFSDMEQENITHNAAMIATLLQDFYDLRNTPTERDKLFRTIQDYAGNRAAEKQITARVDYNIHAEIQQAISQVISNRKD